MMQYLMKKVILIMPKDLQKHLIFPHPQVNIYVRWMAKLHLVQLMMFKMQYLMKKVILILPKDLQKYLIFPHPQVNIYVRWMAKLHLVQLITIIQVQIS